jgi:hypothetical protein
MRRRVMSIVKKKNKRVNWKKKAKINIRVSMAVDNIY